MAETKRLLKVSISIRRKQDFSEVDFNKYWTEKHTPLVKELLAKHGVIRYTQYHTPPSLAQKASNILGYLPLSLAHPYDGVIELLVPSLEVLAAVRSDPVFKSVVEPDESNWCNTSDIKWTVGWEEVYVKDGLVIELEHADVKARRIDDSHYVESLAGDEGVGVEHLGERH